VFNPWAIVAVLLLLGTSSTAGFFFGKDYGRSALLAEQAEAAARQATREAERQVNVEAIGAAAAAAAAVALNENEVNANASVERIRYVEVPGVCRDVDPVSLRELRQGAAAANAALRDGLRSLAALPGAGDPGDAP
jgi:hypothetical protein